MPFFLKQLHGTYTIRGSHDSSSQWFGLIKDYVSRGFHREALLLYTTMLPNRTNQPILAPILKACASLPQASFLGKSLHAESIKLGTVHDLFVGTSLISFYNKCRSFLDARRVFGEMPVRSVVTHNAMIQGCAMDRDMGSASAIFDNLRERSGATWAVMIEGFAAAGNVAAARDLFERMPAGTRTAVTWAVMVHGCAVNGDMDAAKEVFDRMPREDAFASSSMVTGYFKKGDAEEARAVFDRIRYPNLVNWNSLIAGYTQIGRCEEALEAFGRMQGSGLEPDEFTAAAVLSACAQLGALAVGKKVHELIDRRRIRRNEFVLNGLVDMYAKCGDLERARAVFEGMETRNGACWNTMISALASHGRSEEALELFSRMGRSKEKPDAVTFLAVLSSCTHGGLVEEGLDIFADMGRRHGMEAGMGHYGCLVDLLARAGRLAEAYEVIKNMGMRPNEVVWGALLGACRVHMDVDMAKRVAKEVGNGDAEYVMLSNIYTAAEKWEEAEKMRRKMAEYGLVKTPGCSSVVV